MSPLPGTNETNPSIPQSDAPPKVEVSDEKTSQAPKRPPVPQLDGLPPEAKDQLARLEKLFELSDEKLRSIVDQFKADFKVGLGKYGEGMAMIPTFVTGVPNGTEEGTFLALDLGGTNLRVCEVTLKGNHEFSLRQRKYKVSTALKTGEATALFDYMAESVDHFLTEREPTEQVGDLYLGLTFSFPVEQQALDSGLLLTWTKGFSATGAIGKDIVQLLQDAFDRKHLKVKCNALINDTVGALMCHGYSTGRCLLGAIFGTGTNGAFMERIDKIEKLKGKLTADHANFDQMIVNTEWGAFDNARRVLPVTQFDNKVDRESINPRFQLFEKFISGMYQGEICRNLLVNLIDNNILFNGHSTAQLNSHYGLDTSIMSAIETPATDVFDDTGSGAITPHKEPPHSLTSSSVLPRITEATLQDLGPPKAAHIAHDPIHPNSSCQTIQTRKILVEELGFDVETITDNDAEIVLWACKTVATRAARLSACAVAAVVEQTSNTDNGADVGVDGSMVEFYPFFEDRVRQALDALLGEEAQKKVKIGLAKDGSGVGAALGALMAKKMADAVAAK